MSLHSPAVSASGSVPWPAFFRCTSCSCSRLVSRGYVDNLIFTKRVGMFSLAMYNSSSNESSHSFRRTCDWQEFSMRFLDIASYSCPVSFAEVPNVLLIRYDIRNLEFARANTSLWSATTAHDLAVSSDTSRTTKSKMQFPRLHFVTQWRSPN